VFIGEVRRRVSNGGRVDGRTARSCSRWPTRPRVDPEVEAPQRCVHRHRAAARIPETDQQTCSRSRAFFQVRRRARSAPQRGDEAALPTTRSPGLIPTASRTPGHVIPSGSTPGRAGRCLTRVDDAARAEASAAIAQGIAVRAPRSASQREVERVHAVRVALWPGTIKGSRVHCGPRRRRARAAARRAVMTGTQWMARCCVTASQPITLPLSPNPTARRSAADVGRAGRDGALLADRYASGVPRRWSRKRSPTAAVSTRRCWAPVRADHPSLQDISVALPPVGAAYTPGRNGIGQGARTRRLRRLSARWVAQGLADRAIA